MDSLNVLLVVWDACRLDTAREHAPTLNELAANNLWFENAITPAGYSLPSHASMFTGQNPHEHGTFSRTHEFDSLPLLDRLGEQGYTRYGVSANGFASPRYRFDEGFDEFYNTQGQMVYPDGLDVHRYARENSTGDGEFSVNDVRYLDVLRATLRHPRPLKSLANVAAAGLSELGSRYPALRAVPHPRFSRYQEFTYSPSKNTDIIESVIRREAETDDPFFLFTNYMDPHHPYAPPERLQRKHCGRTFSYRELADLAERTLPWNFLADREAGQPLGDEELATVRTLYAGEVRHADEHLERLLDALDRTGMREETLVVVTADHGENLGETDRLGETRMGHECSASDHLLRVPLVVAHPSIEPANVTEYVSLKDLYGLITEGAPELIRSNGEALDPLFPKNGQVASQVPPPANPTLQERYPELSDVLERSLSVMYTDGWKVVVTSQGEQYCWHQDEPRPLDQAPEDLVEAAQENLASLVELSETDRELSEAQVAQLESLGYV